MLATKAVLLLTHTIIHSLCLSNSYPRSPPHSLPLLLTRSRTHNSLSFLLRLTFILTPTPPPPPGDASPLIRREALRLVQLEDEKHPTYLDNRLLQGER